MCSFYRALTLCLLPTASAGLLSTTVTLNPTPLPNHTLRTLRPQMSGALGETLVHRSHSLGDLSKFHAANDMTEERTTNPMEDGESDDVDGCGMGPWVVGAFALIGLECGQRVSRPNAPDAFELSDSEDDYDMNEPRGSSSRQQQPRSIIDQLFDL